MSLALLSGSNRHHAFGFSPASISTKHQLEKKRTRNGKTPLHSVKESPEDDDSAEPSATEVAAKPLEPFLAAADPLYASTAPVGEEDFVLERTGGPLEQELSNENILKIVKIQCSDLEVNTLVWKCLGYRFDDTSKKWTPEKVFPKWKERFPSPPDLIGMQRIYSKEVDEPCLRSNQALVRSIPAEHKQSLKPAMKPLGWSGYKFSGLTPNMTRRAQCANWLIYYREELFGYTVEELRERRRLKREAEERKKQQQAGDDEWKPPVKEVF